MFKKIQSELIGKIKRVIILGKIIILGFFTNYFIVSAASDPLGLSGHGLPGDSNSTGDIVSKVGGNLVSELIQYVAVIAVISLMISGVMYLISGGEEEKVKKAKTWIISSLVGVVLSISAFVIIKIINNITI